MPNARGTIPFTSTRQLLSRGLRALRAKQLPSPLRSSLSDDMLTRYGITAPKAFGIPMAGMQQHAKRLGHHHALAAALWETGWYEARMVACMAEIPALVTPVQMNRWVKDFDNWGICDTVCFKLFDRVPTARRLAASDDLTSRCIGKDALRDLTT